MSSAAVNATAASLLGFLHQGPMAGWDLAQRVETTVGDFWNVSRSQIYRELRVLDEAGLVEAHEAGSRDRRPYSITDAGREAFKTWISREPGDDVIRSPLLLTVFFGADVDERRMARFLAVHRLRHEQRLEHYEELAASLAAGDGVEWAQHALRYGIEHERAVLRWFEGFDAATTSRDSRSRD
ncbi:MAG TPA: PadR family transcriptional regulator [Candidatus Dormibacteraeota bacterium]|jgi:DNA-binding PadR family transcriptional regulator|nr:PadR family transcriptional regulator [Candidatus Dormibacteraeota bacterium]